MSGHLLIETFPVGPLRCNCTIAGDLAAAQAIVIDPGENVADILERLQKHGLVCCQIIVTHAHIDHVGGAAALKRATGAPVLLNQGDLPLLAMVDEQAKWLGVRTPPTAEPDADAAEGMTVGIDSLRGLVLHTPGHTKGSICIHFAAEKLLVAGDTLFAGSIGRTDLWGGDAGKLLDSIHERLLVLPEDTRVIAGHGPATLIGREKSMNPFLT